MDINQIIIKLKGDIMMHNENYKCYSKMKLKTLADISLGKLAQSRIILKLIEREQKATNEPQALPMFDVSGSLAYQKAVEYAKFIHGEEYDDPIFAPDVEQTIRDFQSGFATAMRIANDR